MRLSAGVTPYGRRKASGQNSRKGKEIRGLPTGTALSVAVGVRVRLAVLVLLCGNPLGVSAQTKAIGVTASRWHFDPAVIEGEQGDRVTLTMHSVGGTHGFAIPELRVKTTIPKGGEPG